LTVDGNVYAFGFRMVVAGDEAGGYLTEVLSSSPRCILARQNVIQITSSPDGVLIALSGNIVGTTEVPIVL